MDELGGTMVVPALGRMARTSRVPMRNPFRIGIGAKVCLLSSVIIVATSYITWGVATDLGTKILIDHELIDHDDDTHLGGRSLLASIQALREDARNLATLVGGALGDRGGSSEDAAVVRNQIGEIL